MRILLLCDRYPNSYRDGLLLRVLHLAKRLRQSHQIDLLCYHAGALDGGAVEIFNRIWNVPPPERKTSRGWLALIAGWNPYKLYPRSMEMERLLKEEIKPQDYHVVWDAGASLFLHLPPLWDAVPVLADLVDDMVLTFWRAMKSERRTLRKLRIFKYLTVNFLFERYCMRRTAHCVVVSENDAVVFRNVSPKVPVSVIKNGVDMDFFVPSAVKMISGRLVFEGSMAFPPNQQAAHFLVKEIMPRIWEKCPDASLTLVGRDPSPDILALASEQVYVTGAVDDIRPYILEAEVFICPLQSGAGIKNKLLQAWAMGKAVVATSLSVGGLGAKDGENLLIRDNPQAIADAVLELFSNPELMNLLGGRGRASVEEIFSWQRQADLFECLLFPRGVEFRKDPAR